MNTLRIYLGSNLKKKYILMISKNYVIPIKKVCMHISVNIYTLVAFVKYFQVFVSDFRKERSH